MITKRFQESSFPCLHDASALSGTERNAPIDEAAVNSMVRYAYENG